MKFFQQSINPIWIFVILLTLVLSFTTDYFFELSNFMNILVQTSTIGLIALGMTFVIINGNIDLSVGSVVALSASLSIGLQQDLGILPAVFFALLAGVLSGFLNGMIVRKTGVDAFIVTLGAMIGIRGLVFVYTGEQSFFAEDFTFVEFGESSLFSVPVLGIIFIGFSILMHFIISKTIHGRNTVAVGGNREAAIHAGIKVGKNMVMNFMIVGFFAALSGVTLATQMGASTPTLGRDFELWAIIAVVLGGTRLTGGHGSIFGTVGGVLAIGILRNGMNLLHVPAFYVPVILGSILIFVLFIDKNINRSQSHEISV